jgi:hypothetical protein
MVRKLDQLVGLIGWRQGKCTVTIRNNNLASTSGRKFEEFSSLINTNSVYYAWPDFNSASRDGDIENDFNAFLENLVIASINQVFNYVFKQNEDLLESGFVYPYEFDFNHTLENGGDFVGFEVDVTHDKMFSTIVNKVHATFDADGTVSLLCFNSSKKLPIYSKDIPVLQDTTVEVDLDWALDHGLTGKYYIGYLTDGLIPKAYDRRFELGNLPQCFKFSYWLPIKFAGHNTETMPDVNNDLRVSNTFGLNFDISAFKDYTQILLTNKSKFIDAIGMQVACNVLDLYINNTRSNRDERINSTEARLALEGNTNPQLGLLTQGLRTRLQEEIQSLKNLFIRKPMIERSTLH